MRNGIEIIRRPLAYWSGIYSWPRPSSESRFSCLHTIIPPWILHARDYALHTLQWFCITLNKVLATWTWCTMTWKRMGSERRGYKSTGEEQEKMVPVFEKRDVKETARPYIPSYTDIYSHILYADENVSVLNSLHNGGKGSVYLSIEMSTFTANSRTWSAQRERWMWRVYV